MSNAASQPPAKSTSNRRGLSCDGQRRRKYRSADWAALYPHMPWTPGPGGVAAEQSSCNRPGIVSSLVRVLPPISAHASNTVTSTPFSASVRAAANPLGPDPTTMAVLIGLQRRLGVSS